SRGSRAGSAGGHATCTRHGRHTARHQAYRERRDNVAGDNCSWTDWMGKRSLHRSRNPITHVANGIVGSTVKPMKYLVQKPGDVAFQTHSLSGLRVAVASGQVQLDWQARHNGKEMTVTEALKEASTCYECYECGKEISSLAAACPSCGASPRAAQPSLGSTT